MSSITTAVPHGPINTDWCIQDILFVDGNTPNGCANSTRGQKSSDFETICCVGDIVDTTQNLFAFRITNSINLANLVCCRIEGPQAGGFGPINTVATACTEGTPTPLASMAATNTDNAALYRETFTSASFGGETPGDFVPTMTPTCLWVYTKTGMALRNVTVPAADITTLPPATTGYFVDYTKTDNSVGEVSSFEFSQSTDEPAATASRKPAVTSNLAHSTKDAAATASATSSGESCRRNPLSGQMPRNLRAILIATVLCLSFVAVQ